MKLIAFHGKPEIKAEYLARVEAHRGADEIIHGTYWERGKGCAVGCTVHSDSHASYETELGIPRILARLEDRIFEGMSNGKAKDFPVRFLSVINPGADLSLVWPRFAVWLLTDPKEGVIRFSKKDSAQWIAINRVSDLYRKLKDWDKRDKNAFRAANAAAYAANAAAYAADDAAYAANAAAANAYAANAYAANAAAYAADDAAYAANAAAYAANAAAYAAAYAADDAAYAANALRISYERQADKLIQLLGEAE